MKKYILAAILILSPLYSQAKAQPISVSQCYLVINTEKELPLPDMPFPKLLCGYKITVTESLREMRALSRYNYLKESPERIHPGAFVNIFRRIDRLHDLLHAYADFTHHLVVNSFVQNNPALYSLFVQHPTQIEQHREHLSSLNTSWIGLMDDS